MRSKVCFSVILSVLLHAALVFGFFSRIGHSGREAEDLVVELVSLDQEESDPTLPDNSIGSPDHFPPEPSFPMGPDENFSIEEEAPPPSEPFSDPDAAEQFPPSLDQEEQERALPEESDPPFDPDFPPSEKDIEESLPEEQANLEPAFRLVAEVGPSEKGLSGSTVSEGTGQSSTGGGAPEPTVGDALPGGIGAVGGGQAGPRFVVPKAGRSNPKPRYPEGARAEGREGTALLKVTVLPTGKVGEALIERSSGHADLDRSAVEAVMKWTFLPARRGENPVVSSVRIPVTFALDRP